MIAPTLEGFIEFLQNVADFNTTVLPTTTPVIEYAYFSAVARVNKNLQLATPLYISAVYNLATDFVVRFAPDQTGQDFFRCLRKSLNVNAFAPGVTSSSSDEGTSESLLVPKVFENLSIGDLQNLRTPWGREYLAIAQMYGPSAWGIS